MRQNAKPAKDAAPYATYGMYGRAIANARLTIAIHKGVGHIGGKPLLLPKSKPSCLWPRVGRAYLPTTFSDWGVLLAGGRQPKQWRPTAGCLWWLPPTSCYRLSPASTCSRLQLSGRASLAGAAAEGNLCGSLIWDPRRAPPSIKVGCCGLSCIYRTVQRSALDTKSDQDWLWWFVGGCMVCTSMVDLQGYGTDCNTNGK